MNLNPDMDIQYVLGFLIEKLRLQPTILGISCQSDGQDATHGYPPKLPRHYRSNLQPRSVSIGLWQLGRYASTYAQDRQGLTVHAPWRGLGIL